MVCYITLIPPVQTRESLIVFAEFLIPQHTVSAKKEIWGFVVQIDISFFMDLLVFWLTYNRLQIILINNRINPKYVWFKLRG